MKKSLPLTSDSFGSKNAHFLGASPFDRLTHGQPLEQDKLSKFLTDIQNKIHEGFAKDAKERCFEILENYANSLDTQAQINQLLSIALEKQGSFADSLKALQPFESEQVMTTLTDETRAAVLAQLAIGYANFNDAPKAIALLNSALKIAEDRDLIYLLADIHLALARVYQELNEFPIARNYVEKSLNFARDLGDWRGLAEAYRINANGYLFDGNGQKSLELFQQALKIIGDRPAQYLLGKIYSEMSTAYCAVFRPADGIENLKKAIVIFNKIEQQFESVIANYHLGISLLQGGDWKKAAENLNRALDSALETNHPYLALILASLSEIEILRHDYEEAEKVLTTALEVATKDRYRIPVLSNLARCLLAQGKFDAAIIHAKNAVEYSKKTKAQSSAKLANLILAEAYLNKRKGSRVIEILQNIEADENSANYSIIGQTARIRALQALTNDDYALAENHFNRSLTAFGMANDHYHLALVNYEIGKNFIEKQPDKAAKNLESAASIFTQLEATESLKLVEEILATVGKKEVSPPHELSISLQMLMLRLIEAVSSREMLIRELITILRQNGTAKKIMIAELNDGRQFQPALMDGFETTESAELLAKLKEATNQDDLDKFAQEKNIFVLQLRSPNALPALLVIAPATGAILADGSAIQPLLQVVELGMEVCALREISQDKPAVSTYNSFATNSIMPGFIHSSPAMMMLVEEIQQIATSDVTVLITGESGTGKELIARAVHHVSQLKNKVFVPFNCTAIPKELTEGHLFGYKKGAFTGAFNDNEGVIRAADGGTLFLDEIGDLPLDVQPKILRFLQEGEVQPLGENMPKKVDVRIIAATNMRVEEMMRNGSFREDLYYRLNVIRLEIPPLRERRSEIPQLIDHYLNYYSAKFGRKDLSMSSEALDLLIAFHWQGNVRQLCNEVQRMVARANSGDKISIQHLSADIKPDSDSVATNLAKNVSSYGLTEGGINLQIQDATLEEAVSALETRMVSDSIKRHDHNISKVAKELGITRRGIYLKMERYNLK